MIIFCDPLICFPGIIYLSSFPSCLMNNVFRSLLPGVVFFQNPAKCIIYVPLKRKCHYVEEKTKKSCGLTGTNGFFG